MERRIEPEQTIVQGKYRLMRHLSRGGQADVWEAEQAGIAGFRKAIVLKLLRSDRVFTAEAQQVLLQEARLAAQLHHPNIVEIYDVGQEDDLVYIAMERIDGQDLRIVLDRCWSAWQRPLPWPLVVRLGTRIARALQHAHQKVGVDGRLLGIVHRDLKPANVILAREGFLKLIDFGIAKSYAVSGKHSGVLKGTAAYMSPEQILGQSLDGRSDIFSLGSILYELCTCVRPFEPTEGGMGAQIFAVVDHEPPPMRTYREDIPPSLEAVVERMLKKDREDRFADAKETHRALEQVLREHQIFLEQDDLAEFFEDLMMGAAIQEDRFSPPAGRSYLAGIAGFGMPHSPPHTAHVSDDWDESTQYDSVSSDDWSSASTVPPMNVNDWDDQTHLNPEEPSHARSLSQSPPPPSDDWEVATQIAPSWMIQSGTEQPTLSATGDPTITPSLEQTFPDDEQAAAASWGELAAVSPPLFAEVTAEEPSYRPHAQELDTRRKLGGAKNPAQEKDDRTHIELQSFGVLEAIQAPPVFLQQQSESVSSSHLPEVPSVEPFQGQYHASSGDALSAVGGIAKDPTKGPITKDLDPYTPLQELPTQEMTPIRAAAESGLKRRSPATFEAPVFRDMTAPAKKQRRWWLWGVLVFLILGVAGGLVWWLT
ncbi:MAG: protein kinase [Myxococcales bacterium]|nr:protein kinase [Myxococcales bacterium]